MAIFDEYGRRLDLFRDNPRALPLPVRPQELGAFLIGQNAGFLNNYIKGLVSSPAEIAGGIPVGEDPDLPMSQEQFNDYVRGRIEGRGGTKMRRALEPYGGTIIPIMRQHFKGASRGISDADFARVLNDSSLNQSQSQDLAMAFPTVRGKMDAAESLKLYRRPDGTTYYVGPGGRELSPVEVDRIMKTGVRGANRGFSGFELAQAYPTHQPVGPAGGLGGPMQMGPQYGPKPLNIDINAVDDRLESIGGSVNIPLGRENILRLGGGFNPAYEQDGLNVGQGYQMYGSFQTPGVGVNATYRRTPQMGNQFGGQINARF